MDKKERTKKPMKKGAKWALVIFIWETNVLCG